MKIYTIIGGVNGTGKSSLTGALKAERSDLGMIIDVDKISAQCGSRIEGGKRAVQKIESCIDRGMSFTQETTLSGVRTLRTVQKARNNQYYIRLYYVGLSSETESIKRIRNRVEKGGHDIPQEDVHRRYQTRYEDLVRVLPYCDEAFFFDNENGFVQVAEYKNGELIFQRQDCPAWINTLADQLKEKE